MPTIRPNYHSRNGRRSAMEIEVRIYARWDKETRAVLEKRRFSEKRDAQRYLIHAISEWPDEVGQIDVRVIG